MSDADMSDASRAWLLLRQALLLFALGAGVALLLPRSPELARLPGIIASADHILLALMLLLLLLSNGLRALRLHIILQSEEPFPHTFHAANIGNFANSLLPLRAGEFCIAALLAKGQVGGLAEALSKILADRLLDILAVAVFFIGALLLLIPSGHAAQENTMAAITTGASLAGVVLFIFIVTAFEAQLVLLLQSIGGRLGRNLDPLAATLNAGGEGLRSLFRNGVLVRAIVLSFAIWLVIATTFWVGMIMLGLPSLFSCAIFAMSFTIAGLITVPVPAGVGTTHGAIVIALTLFGLGFEQSLAFAIVYHALSVGLNIGLGLLGLKCLELDLAGLKRLIHSARDHDISTRRRSSG